MPDKAEAPGQTQAGTTDTGKAPAADSPTNANAQATGEPEWKKGYDGLRTLVNRQGTVLANIERQLGQIAQGGQIEPQTNGGEVTAPNPTIEELRLNQAKLDFLITHPEAKGKLAEIEAVLYDPVKVQPYAAYLRNGLPNYAKMYGDVYRDFKTQEFEIAQAAQEQAKAKAEEEKQRMRLAGTISGESASAIPETITREVLKDMTAEQIAKKYGHLLAFDPKDPPSHLR